jgi:hypothetical protein
LRVERTTLTVEQLELLPDEALRPLLKVWLAQLAELRQRVTDLENGKEIESKVVEIV